MTLTFGTDLYTSVTKVRLRHQSTANTRTADQVTTQAMSTMTTDTETAVEAAALGTQ